MQDDLARLVLQLAGKEQPAYVCTPEKEVELAASEAEADRGEFATDEQIHAISEVPADSMAVEQIRQIARTTFGSDEKAQRWLSRPTAALSGSSPLDISLAGANGVSRVINLLRRIDHGLSV